MTTALLLAIISEMSAAVLKSVVREPIKSLGAGNSKAKLLIMSKGFSVLAFLYLEKNIQYDPDQVNFYFRLTTRCCVVQYSLFL